MNPRSLGISRLKNRSESPIKSNPNFFENKNGVEAKIKDLPLITFEKLTSNTCFELSLEKSKKFNKILFDTWNLNQFKTQEDKVAIPFNKKFPIKHISFDCNKLFKNCDPRKMSFENHSNQNNQQIVKKKVNLGKLSIDKLNVQSGKMKTPFGFHQMFLSMADKFSPSWREQINQFIK